MALARAAKMDRVTLMNALIAKDQMIHDLVKELAATTRELAKYKDGRA